MLVYEPLEPDHWRDPYPVYRALRDEAPAHFAPKTGVYCISRYDDVVRALTEHDVFSSESAFEAVMMQGRPNRIRARDAFEIARFLWRARINPIRARKNPPRSLITCDPPRHDDMRAIVNRGFTPRRSAAWEPRMREIVEGCMAGLRAGQPFDVIRDLGIPLPVTVIAELLGVDPEHRLDFKRWSDEIIAGSSGSGRNEALGSFMRSLGELRSFLGPIIADRRAHPADDLISLITDPALPAPLDDDAVFQFVLLLLIAGNETTTNLIGNAAIALLDHPDQLARVHDDPSLVPAVVEEVLRYDSPIQFVFRRTTRDVVVAGTTIPAESRIAVLLAAGNRDERRFPDPERFDIDRDTRGHLGFGFGLHFCLGASLARLEGRIALEALVQELPRLRRAESEPPLVDSFLVRGPKRLELVEAA